MIIFGMILLKMGEINYKKYIYIYIYMSLEGVVFFHFNILSFRSLTLNLESFIAILNFKSLILIILIFSFTILLKISIFHSCFKFWQNTKYK